MIRFFILYKYVKREIGWSKIRFNTIHNETVAQIIAGDNNSFYPKML